MADFHLTINYPGGDDTDIVVEETNLIAFRLYERLSGTDPTLDQSKSDLQSYSPDDESPESPFDSAAVRHAPPVLNRESTSQPPYYIRVLFSPSVLPADQGAQSLLGRVARLSMTDGYGDIRHVRGVILRILDRNGPFGRSSAVEVQIYPALWALSLSEKSRVWLEIDSVSLIRQLLSEYRDDLEDKPVLVERALASKPGARESLIQWDESDFDFLSRLLERDGIYYYFTHDDRQSRIHLADARSPYAEGDLPHRELALEPTLGPGGELFDDHVSFITTQLQSVPRSYQVADYNPLKVQTPLTYGAPADVNGGSAMQIYDYPGEFQSLGEGPEIAGRRFAALAARTRVVYAASRCPYVSAGHVQTLPAPDPDDADTPVRVTQAVHELVRDADGKPYYRNWFEAIDGETPYAPTQRTPIPAIYGTHNATVISSFPKETVDVDEHSRALVVFRWDPNARPVRVRLGQPWAGANHGMSILPRTGDEVLVGFIQGNTERPIILTSLHHSNTPKKVNPTLMETRGLEDDLAPGPQRQNRYATVLHNTTGNAVYINDDKTAELLKIDAHKDFVLEVGHKKDSNGSFITNKDDRGEALIRTYGSLNLVVGKINKNKEIPLSELKEAGEVPDSSIDRGNRGDYNLYIFGDRSTLARGDFNFVGHPDYDYLISADYTHADYAGVNLKATASFGNSVGVHAGASTSISWSAAASVAGGFASSYSLGASLSSSVSAAVSSSETPFSLTMDSSTKAVVKGIFGEFNTGACSETFNALKIQVVTSPTQVTAETTAQKVASGAITGLNYTTAAAVGIAATVIEGFTINTGNESTTKTFLKEHLPRMHLAMQISAGTVYVISTGVLITLAGMEKLHQTPMPTNSRVVITPTTGVEYNHSLSSVNKLSASNYQIQTTSKSEKTINTTQNSTKLTISCPTISASGSVSITGKVKITGQTSIAPKLNVGA